MTPRALLLPLAALLFGCGTPRTDVPGDLARSWRWGSVSSVGFYDPATGSWAAPSGMGEAYTFTADGEYTNSYLIQTSLFSCTTTFFGWVRGTVEVDGHALRLHPNEHKTRSEDNCNEAYNYERDGELDATTFGWNIEVDEYGDTVLLLQKAGAEDFTIYYLDS